MTSASGMDPAGAARGTDGYMDRTELLGLVSASSSLNQISSVTAAVRTWLIDHPDDDRMREALVVLSRHEREHFAARG